MALHDLKTAIAVLENHTNEMKQLFILEGKNPQEIEELLKPHVIRIQEIKKELGDQGRQEENDTIFND